ncbi:cytochrome P450 2J6-like [Branchiostoma floridae]|uniref:Cytochrome P450 2J6-like n=1 Tax=Branchiostoma floridae TaxID=7739 RepID=A0A9J7HHA5_BRAFL|nr:cytochrome P450 2J6-like [Branchiostoma floridae]
MTEAILDTAAAAVASPTENVQTFLVLMLGLLAGYLLWRRVNPPNLPPGPWGLPGLGAIPFLGLAPHETLMTMSKAYGDIMSVRLGPKLAVVLNGQRAIHQALIKRAGVFSDRPGFELVNMVHKGRGIIAGPSTDFVQRQRRFLMRSFRTLGLNTHNIENCLQAEVQTLMTTLKQVQGNSGEVYDVINRSVVNAIAVFSFGNRFNHNDPKFHRLVSCLEGVFRFSSTGVGLMTQAFPVLLKFPRGLPGLSQFLEDGDNFLSIIRDIVKSRRQVFAEILQKDPTLDDFKPSDILDCYFQETTRGQAWFMSDEDFCHMIMDNYIAGTTTTRLTMQWAMLLLTISPREQTKMHDEIVSVVGTDRLPSLKDKDNLPYTKAAIFELLRISCVTPLSLPREAADDVIIDGHRIPKGTMVMTNLWSVTNDPDVWEDPRTFKPERFLNEQGECVLPKEWLPFSTGKRSCIGQAIAESMMFMYISAIVQNYRIYLPAGKTVPTAEPIPAMHLHPQPCEISFAKYPPC